MGHAGDERVAHAKGSMAVSHARIGPAFRESLKLIELVGNKTAKTAIGTFDDVLEAARSRAAFSCEDGAARLVERHYGETDRQIAEQYGLEYTGNKAQWTTLVYRMLGIKNNAAEEFVKAGINVRACRVNKRGHIEQAMSFPPFEFKQLINEDWETSSFRARLETSRFFFVVFREDHEGMWRLDRCLFWAMPANEIEGPAKACWDETRKVIRKGVELNSYRDASGKLKVTNNLPGMADNPIVHVRPHTSKAAYKFADGTEVGDIARNACELPDGRWMTKQSFWFNKGYLEHILGL